MISLSLCFTVHHSHLVSSFVTKEFVLGTKMEDPSVLKDFTERKATHTALSVPNEWYKRCSEK